MAAPFTATAMAPPVGASVRLPSVSFTGASGMRHVLFCSRAQHPPPLSKSWLGMVLVTRSVVPSTRVETRHARPPTALVVRSSTMTPSPVHRHAPITMAWRAGSTAEPDVGPDAEPEPAVPLPVGAGGGIGGEDPPEGGAVVAGTVVTAGSSGVVAGV